MQQQMVTSVMLLMHAAAASEWKLFVIHNFHKGIAQSALLLSCAKSFYRIQAVFAVGCLAGDQLLTCIADEVLKSEVSEIVKYV